MDTLMNPIILLEIFSREALLIVEVKNRQRPSGGVAKPKPVIS